MGPESLSLARFSPAWARGQASKGPGPAGAAAEASSDREKAWDTWVWYGEITGSRPPVQHSDTNHKIQILSAFPLAFLLLTATAEAKKELGVLKMPSHFLLPLPISSETELLKFPLHLATAGWNYQLLATTLFVCKADCIADRCWARRTEHCGQWAQ